MHPVATCEISAGAMTIRVGYGEDSYLAREAVLRLREDEPEPSSAGHSRTSAQRRQLGLADSEHFSRRVKAALLYLAGQAG